MQINVQLFKKSIYLLSIIFGGAIPTCLIASKKKIPSYKLPDMLPYNTISFSVATPKIPKKEQNWLKKKLQKAEKQEYRIDSLIKFTKNNQLGNTIMKNNYLPNPKKSIFFIKNFQSLNQFLNHPCHIKLSNQKQINSLAKYLNLSANTKIDSLKLSYRLCLFIVYWNKKHLSESQRKKLTNTLDLTLQHIQKEKILILRKNKSKIAAISIIELIELLLPHNAVLNYSNPHVWHFIPPKLIEWMHTHPAPFQAYEYPQLGDLGYIFHLSTTLKINFKKLPTHYITRQYIDSSRENQATIQSLMKQYFSTLHHLDSLCLFIKESIGREKNFLNSTVFTANRSIPDKVIWFCKNGLRFVMQNNGKKYGVIFKMEELYSANRKKLKDIYVQYKKDKILRTRFIFWFSPEEARQGALLLHKNLQEALKKETFSINSINFYEKCGGCKKRLKVKPKTQFLCGGCKKIGYCNRKCQKYHWKYGHKQECQLTQ